METKEKNYSEQLEATAEAIATHIEKKSGTGLSTTISKWIDVLEDHKDLKSIAGNLKKLKTAIDEKDFKKVVMVMETLGEQTTDAAEMAKGSDATKIKALGKALTAGSKTIAKFA